MLIKFRKAQATAEYAILFAVVVGAALAVQSRVKKALEARVFDALEDYRGLTGGTTNQWEGVQSNTHTNQQYSNRYYLENYEANAEAPFSVNVHTGATYSQKTVQ